MYTSTAMMATETTPVMLTRKLGEGSCGSVFCGSLTASGKRVAVKVVRKGTSAKAALNLHRVRTEANVMARLDHRNVARCLGTWETSEHFYLFLKFARGGDLCDRLLHGGPMTERSARRRFGQLLAAVAHLHAKGLAHRDIKPENILLDELGHFMLAGMPKFCHLFSYLISPLPCDQHSLIMDAPDFGLAVTLSPQKKVSGRAGTVGYTAPEVWVDRPYDAAAADVFSCGSGNRCFHATFPFLHTTSPFMEK
jgi:serine/threonine protein kinase